MPIRGVIFDLDGTLVDSGLDFAQIRREMRLPEGVPILEALAEIGPGGRRDECLWILERHEHDASRRATIIPGVAELLGMLDARGIHRGILTRNSRLSTTRVLKRLGLSFSAVLTREDVPPKPDPAGLLAICSLWNVSVDEAVFVGDYLHDVHCGRNARMRTILFAPNGSPHYAALADLCVADFAAASRYIEESLA